MKNWTKQGNLSDFFTLYGTTGRAGGTPKIEQDGKTTHISGNMNGIYAETVFTEDENGVVSRTGFFRNDTDTPVTLGTALLTYTFDGGEYDVYTQYNGWQNESMGAWQELVTAVSAIAETPRNCSSAAPVLALYNRQSGRGMAFNLLPDGAWEMTARRESIGGEASEVKVTAGACGRKQVITLAPGEILTLPEVLCYPFTNKTDLDAWKLHRYAHKRFPQRTMPVIYNTWMYRFDEINYENISRQIPKAAEIGCEYFVIDAGWFGIGKANWWELRGDWKENETANLCGTMGKIADEVRAAGMKFGFWLETESAGRNSDIVKNHPEWFLCDGGAYYLDFTNAEAVDTMFETVSSLVRKYGAEFLKFDYNQDLFADCSMTALRNYQKGYRAYVERLRREFPDLYLQCCGSGGMRMDLANCAYFDTYWLSDNQSPYEGMRIVKETIKRLPPQRIERWACVTSYDSTQPYPEEKLLACNDCRWDRIVSVFPSYLKAFLTCAPIGVSCDLYLLSEKSFADLKAFIAAFKEEREYWANAECRILCDTPSMLVLQYNDPGFTDVRVQAISAKCRQTHVSVYPVLCENREYTLPDGTKRMGAELSCDGVSLSVDGCDRMKEITFKV